MNKHKQIIVGMSGGVDSSVALMLLKKRGYEPIGVSLKLPVWESEKNKLCENMCCTKESLSLAENICKKLGVPYYVYDVEENFKKVVMSYFKKELISGRTPNPCVICNRFHKFKHLIEFADKKKIEFVATGHYAKKKRVKDSQFSLMIPKDKSKDQTYGLAMLTQKQLKRVIFPLENLMKKEVFKIAEKEGFPVFLKKKESQDLCFVSKKAYKYFLEEEIGIKAGNIYDDKGKFLGTHPGIHFFTIGQKKGLKLPEAYYVKEKGGNNLIVTKNRKEIGSKEVYLRKINFISNNRSKKPINVMAKTRYTQNLSKAKLIPLKSGYKMVFNKLQESVTPGQFCVFYQKNICLGGGIIK